MASAWVDQEYDEYGYDLRLMLVDFELVLRLLKTLAIVATDTANKRVV
jgi:hypothetical protein